jgi:xylulokinase
MTFRRQPLNPAGTQGFFGGNVKADYVIAYDIGSTGNKTCLYRLDGGVTLLAEAGGKYPLTVVENGGVEQDPEDWWRSMRETTREVLRLADLPPGAIRAISFCSQMQGLVLVDQTGAVLRPAMSYMDKRATSQHKRWCAGLVKAAGINIGKLLVSMLETGVVAASAKDPVYRYAWVRENESALFERVHKWLDVKDYLVFRATGRYVSSEDSAFATMLYNTRKRRWSEPVCKLHGVRMDHLAEIVRCTDAIGPLTGAAAAELGLSPGCTVFSGGGDSTLIGLGAGNTKPGETHVYIGTSGWVSTVVDKQRTDAASMIASVIGAIPGQYNYFAEMETSGKCIEWTRDHLVMDEIGAYVKADCDLDHLIEYMCSVAERAPPGSRGVVFMPWLLGNRCPFEDADCRGGFINISLTTKKEDLIRAVFEGILMHKRWMLDRQDAKVKTSPIIRIAGGGARSPVICQMLADILNRPVECPVKPQNAGALGAAILMAGGLGHIASLKEAGGMAQVDKRYDPDPAAAGVYDKNFAVFKRLYRKNRKNFRIMNRQRD